MKTLKDGEALSKFREQSAPRFSQHNTPHWAAKMKGVIQDEYLIAKILAEL